MRIFNLFKSNDVNLSFTKEEKINYTDVEGFFMWNEEIFYRPSKGRGAKHIKSDESFINYVKNTLGASVKVNNLYISNLKVIPLKVIEKILYLNIK